MTRMTVVASVPGILALLVVAGLAGAPQGTEADWKPAAAPLMTPWAKDVSPDKVWPEYPRPQLVRNDWMNLNGLWEYAVVSLARVPDASGLGHDGSAAGAPAWTATGGPGGGGAYTFRGDGDAIHLPRLVSGDFTIAFWVKTTQKGDSGQWFKGAGLVDAEVAGVTNDFGTALVE